MPLLSDLTRQVKEQLGRRLPKQLTQQDNNVETWLTYLSQPNPWLKDLDILANKAAFLEITQVIVRVIQHEEESLLTQDLPSWLCSVLRYWHNNRSHVITLNYDTIVERAASQVIEANGDHVKLYNIYPQVIATIRSRKGGLVLDNRLESFQLHKLHGSTNWYYSGVDNFHGEILYYSDVAPWGSDRSWETQSRRMAADKEALIVPPSFAKAPYFQHETIRYIWNEAGEALRNANRIFVIGYSMPESDLGFRYFFNHFRPVTSCSMYVADVSSKVATRYKAFARRRFRVNTEFVGQNAVHKLVDYLDSGS